VNLEAKLDLAVRAARAAGEATLRHFRVPGLEVETKADASPVTRADREAERILRETIGAAFPDDGILGEEEGATPGTSGHLWILDPVDGTLSFVRGVAQYGTLVGLEVEGRAVLGVAYLPALGEMMYAARGLGAWWVDGLGGPREERRPARVSSVDRPADAFLCHTSVGGFIRTGRLDAFLRLRDAVGRDRGWGDCYGHLLVATGRADIMVDPVLSPWDCAALQPIVEEAGGAFRDLSGRATHRGGSGVSTNGVLADTVQEILQASGPGEPRSG